MLTLYGFVHLTQMKRRGVVMFQRHKTKEENTLLTVLKEAPHAKIIKNEFKNESKKTMQDILYCYPVPAEDIIEEKDEIQSEAFCNLLLNPKAYDDVIPVVELKFDDCKVKIADQI
jgi:hypothetical protein